MCPNPEAFNGSPPGGSPNPRTTTPRRRGRLCCALLTLFLSSLSTLMGCSNAKPGSDVVFYCDGAGWYAGAGRVRSGLREARFQGEFRNFTWSTLLGPGTDHLIAARSDAVARRLTRQIESYRRRNPAARIHVMGLSAGTSVALNAIEQLPMGVQVSNVVLLSSSASSEHDLTPVMRRVSGYLYNTVSRSDAILNALVVNADGLSGAPAGQRGFRRPRRKRKDTDKAYRRVVNLPWKPAYLAYDWDGGHVAATNPKFIRAVIAPRLQHDGLFPLDRTLIASTPNQDQP